MTEAERRELQDVADGVLPIDMRSEKRRVRLKIYGLAWRELYYPWTWHLTDEGREILNQRREA